MTNKNRRRRLLRRLIRIPARFDRWLAYTRSRAFASSRNLLRRLRRVRIDYVVMRIGGSLPERDAPARPFFQRFLPYPPPPLSMQSLNARFRLIAQADNVQGVVLHLTGLSAGLATLQNLRRSITRLKQAGKTVIVFTPTLNISHYYVASAADKIIAPPGATFEVLGLRSETLFLKEALARLGITADVFQISPYKTAGNLFSEPDITPEQRAQLDWLLDDNYDQLTAGMAVGRDMEQAHLQTLIDEAPYPIGKAAEKGLVDHVAYEDELAALLAPESKQPKRARLRTWAHAMKLLPEHVQPISRRFLGVISLEGAISPGASRRSPIDLPVPLLGGAMAGEATLTSLLRRAERMPGLAALILHVDSPGGLAISSDLIWRQVDRVSRKKPVLVYMGNVAASGGYYVSASAQHIMAQEATLTGSIGVISGRFNTDGLYDLLQVKRTTLTRGAHAMLYSDSGSLTDGEQQTLWDNVVHSYERFKEIVSEGRHLPLEGLDEICHGRVWTGRQAKEHRLVDSHGDFIDAIQQATRLAASAASAAATESAAVASAEPDQLPVRNLYAQDAGNLLPLPFEAPKELLGLLIKDRFTAWNGQPLTLLPFLIRWQ